MRYRAGNTSLVVRTAPGDLGSGQSSSTYLGELPLDAHKIDRSCIEQMEAAVAEAERQKLAVVLAW